VCSLFIAPVVQSPLVIFENALEPEQFLRTARAKLSAIGVQGEPVLPTFDSGPRAGEPLRRVLRLKGQTQVGYALRVEGLDAPGAIRLQEQGLGGRLKMGAGFFLPVRD
jgi:CRISPR-associated protein Cas6